MFQISRLSQAAYVGLCLELGTPTELRIRREIDDTEEALRKPVDIMRGLERMKSGGKREGFRLQSSDNDFMFWPTDHTIICNLSQIPLYLLPKHTIIMIDEDDSSPGYTKLVLMNPSNIESIQSSCRVINSKCYISSSLFRSNHCHFLRSTSVQYASASLHGPCTTLLNRENDIDYAFCFKSHHWPTTAIQWIERCRKQGWPSENVILEILREGFHVVPIGRIPESEREWRFSFSQAEHKLVHSMNHCQYLCLGLLKIFLKEVINVTNSCPILCSYFLKTLVLWVIQTKRSLIWTPDNLLSCFWECFRLLIYWVHTGECPNFFIPRNNMFRMKVTGSVQTSLFSQLYDLYCRGISCLLLSGTVRPYLIIALLNRTLRVCTDESSIISTTELDISLFAELSVNFCIIHIEEFAFSINQIERMIKGRLGPYQAVTLQCMTSDVLRNTALLIQSHIFPNKNRNKVYYKSSNKVKVLLKLSCRLGFVSDIFYLAMYFYRTFRYEKSLCCLQKVQERMSRPYIVYNDHTNYKNINRYCMLGRSLGNKVSRALLKDIALYSDYTYIDELVIEQKVNEEKDIPVLIVPPVVILHMLLMLNYLRLGDTIRSQQSLQDFYYLLLSDGGSHVPIHLREISWQILKICKQAFVRSLQSYRYFQQQDPFHYI